MYFRIYGLFLLYFTTIHFHEVSGALTISLPATPTDCVFINLPSLQSPNVAVCENVTYPVPLAIIASDVTNPGLSIALKDPRLDLALTSIDASSATLMLNSPFDTDSLCLSFNTENDCNFVLQINEGGSKPAIFFYPRDSNDNFPVFTNPACNPTVEENFAEFDFPICTFEATDADRFIDTGKLEFSLGSMADEDNLFEINPTTGVLSLQQDKTLDYEYRTSHRLTVTVTDTTGQSVSLTQIIEVKDVADLPPSWNQLSLTISVREETKGAVGTEIYRLSARDQDRDIDDRIVYSLTFIEDGDDYFSLDASTGAITVSKKLNTTEIMTQRNSLSFSANVTAKEANGPQMETETEAIQITVVDEDTDDLYFLGGDSEFSITIPESKSGVIQTFTIVDGDTDLNYNSYTVELQEPSTNPFPEFLQAIGINPKEGNGQTEFSIEVKDVDKLDYDGIDQWRNDIEFKVKITSKSTARPKELEATILLKIEDVNDNTPEWEFEAGTQEFFVNVPENMVGGEQLGIQLSATDGDDDSKGESGFGQSSLIYEWDPSSRIPEDLEIDPKTGEVSVKAGVESIFDYETIKLETYVVKVSDSLGGPNSKSVTALFKISVTDINDVQPTLRVTPSRLTIDENTEVGTQLPVVISANDPDSDSDLEIKIKTVQAFRKGRRVSLFDTSNWFALEEVEDKPNDRYLIIGEEVPDRELVDRVELSITVEDMNTDERYDENIRIETFLLVITIADLNDQPPSFVLDEDKENITAVVTETSADKANENDLRRRIVEIVATDNDLDTLFCFTIEADDPKMLELVEFPPQTCTATGKIWLFRKQGMLIDREIYPTLSFLVTVADSDDETTANTESVIVEITVDDINDSVPQWVNDDYELQELRVTEGLPFEDRVVVTTVEATDADDVESGYGVISYFLAADTAPSLKEIFAVDQNTGEVTANPSKIDREKDEEFTFAIEAIDSYGTSAINLSNKTILHIKVLDINDNVPKFEAVLEDPSEGILVSVAENETIPNSPIGNKIVVSDADESGPNSDITVELNGISCYRGDSLDCDDQGEDPFRIETDRTNPRSQVIQIFTSDLFDFTNAYGLYCLNITARNDEEEPNFEEFCIDIIDVNNNAPYFSNYSETQLYIKEFYNTGEVLRNYTGDYQLIFQADDDDDPRTDNGKFEYRIDGDENAVNYIGINEEGGLYLKAMWNATANLKSMTVLIVASDLGETPQDSEPLEISLTLVPDGKYPPEFLTASAPLTIKENEPLNTVIGMFEAANDNDIVPGFPEPDKIYYYIAGYENATTFFQLANNENPVLSTKLGLDREAQDTHTILVYATNYQIPPAPVLDPSEPLRNKSYTLVTINVKDTIDVVPRFEQSVISAGISSGTESNTIILGNDTLTAIDDDLEDLLRYEISRIEASDPSLEGVVQPAFKLTDLGDNQGANLTIAFKPQSSMKGFFSFNLTVTDKANLSSSTQCKIYLVSEANFVYFQFINNYADVQAKRIVIQDIMSEVYGYRCNIESIDQTVDEDTGNGIEGSTTVKSHFVDIEKNEPIQDYIINNLPYEQPMKYQELVVKLANQTLTLQSLGDGGKIPEESNTDQIIIYVLVAGCALLFVILLISGVVFFFKNNSMARKLKALNAVVGANENDMQAHDHEAVPNTNMYSNMNSNPVLSNDPNKKMPDFDNHSTSGSSVLSGASVEDFKAKGDNDNSDVNSIYENEDDYGVPYGSEAQDFEQGGVRNPAYNPDYQNPDDEEDKYDSVSELPKVNSSNTNTFGSNPYASVSRRNPLMTMGLEQD